MRELSFCSNTLSGLEMVQDAFLPPQRNFGVKCLRDPTTTIDSFYPIYRINNQTITRLTYNCAHLRSTKESLTIFWVKIIRVKFFLSENFLGEHLLWGVNIFFVGECFLSFFKFFFCFIFWVNVFFFFFG